jgi:hypothetical protein
MDSTWDGLGDTPPPEWRPSGKIGHVLIRDANYRAPRWRRWWYRLRHPFGRPIEPPWSPFAADGTLRDDLLAVRKVDGAWLPNPEPNDGFYPLGTMRDEDDR